MTQIYSNPLKFFESPFPEYPGKGDCTLDTMFISFVFSEKKFECKICLFVSRLPGARNMGMEEVLAPVPNFNRPVKDLVYKDLLTNTFTQVSHDRGIRSCRVSTSYPQCVFCIHTVYDRGDGVSEHTSSPSPLSSLTHVLLTQVHRFSKHNPTDPVYLCETDVYKCV